MVRQRHQFPPIAWVLLVSVIVTLPAIFTRSITYDETISLLEVSAAPPNTDLAVRSSAVPASRLKEMFSGHRGFVSITQLIRELDIHPPIYYWTLRAWRQAFGSSIQVARLLSLTALLATIMAFYYLVRAVGYSRPTLAALVMVSVGWGRGDPWSYVYELDPDTEVVFFHWSTVTTELGRLASGYDEVWFLRASDRSISKREEKAWGEVLQASGHREVMSLAKGLILKAN